MVILGLGALGGDKATATKSAITKTIRRAAIHPIKLRILPNPLEY